MKIKNSIKYATLLIPTLLLIIISIRFGNLLVGIYGAVGWLVFIIFFILGLKQNYQLKKTEKMKWVTYRSANWLEKHYSDQFERIVPINNGIPIRVQPRGGFRVKIFKNYDQLAVVDLRSKQIKIPFSENDQFVSKDSVKIEGLISIKTSIKDFNEAILKLVSNEKEEEETMVSYLKIAAKTIISQYNWKDLSIFSSKTLGEFKEALIENLSKINFSFHVDDIIDISLTPIDKKFAAVIEKKQMEIEETKLKIQKLESEKEAQKIVFESEKIKIEKEHENESIRQKKQIELENERHQNEIKIAEEKHKLELEKKKETANLEQEIFQERLKILKDNDEALAIINPQLYEKISIANIESEKEKNIRLGNSNETLIKMLISSHYAKMEARGEFFEKAMPQDRKLELGFTESKTTESEIESLKKQIEELKLKIKPEEEKTEDDSTD